MRLLLLTLYFSLCSTLVAADIVQRLTGKITDIVPNGRTTVGKRQPNDTGHWKDLTWMTATDYAK